MIEKLPKIVQISSGDPEIYGLDEDGNLFMLANCYDDENGHYDQWEMLIENNFSRK